MTRRVSLPRRARGTVRALCAAPLLALVCAACGSSGALNASIATPTATRASAIRVPAGPANVRVGGDAAVAPTSTSVGFIGLASEISTIPALAGTATDPNHALVALLKNLSPGAPFLLRLGGDSTDWSWWAVPGMAQPRAIRYTITPAWAAGVKTLLGALGGRTLLGVNLELDNPQVAAYEISQYNRYLGASAIAGFELGNEPELYPAFNYYTLANGHGVKGRARGYNIPAYGQDFTRIAAHLGSAPLVGPSIGAPEWLTQLHTILADLPSRLGLATVHAYPMKHCSAHTHLPVSEFFAPASIQGLAGQVSAMVRAASARHRPLRVDEINGVSCGGEVGMSNTFAESLWALNMMPALWQAGVQGVNIQTINGNLNQMITATHTAGGWRVSTQPEYLGLLAFAQAAPGGSHLERVSVPSGQGLYAFATRTPSHQEHVVITNVGPGARSVNIAAAGGRGAASVELLTAGSLAATGGESLGGQSLSSVTGQLAGAQHLTQVAPNAKGVYAVRVPAHSAAILTLAH